MATSSNGAVSIETSPTAVVWAPVFAGAAVAIAMTLIFLALGSGLGFAVASPWPGSGPSITTFAVGVGVWLIVTQWVSSFFGGYITGRLRTRWVGVHTKEVVFRDTAHGLLAWAVSTAIVAAVTFGATSSMTSSASTAASATLAGATDTALRPTRSGGIPNAEARAEVSRLLGAESGLQAGDRDYLTGVVAEQTGVSKTEAQQRVDTAVSSIRNAADKARKASSAIGLFTALSMFIGAFIACVAAAYAGELRDKYADLADRR